MGKEVELLKDHAHLRADLGDMSTLVVEFDAVYDNSSRLVLFQTVDATDKRRLTRPGRAANHHLLTPPDRQVDIWAFGCVMLEMLSGRKVFGGDTVTDMIAAVVATEPDWEKLPSDTPRALERLLRRCLEKDQDQRLRDIGEMREQMENF